MLKGGAARNLNKLSYFPSDVYGYDEMRASLTSLSSRHRLRREMQMKLLGVDIFFPFEAYIKRGIYKTNVDFFTLFVNRYGIKIKNKMINE